MPKKVSEQTRDCAVRLVLDHFDEYETLSATVARQILWQDD